MARERDYSAERAAARARAAALGLSPSAALGKPRKGEASKAGSGLDMRTKAGRASAQAKAQALGTPLAPEPTLVKTRVGSGAVSTASTFGKAEQVIRSLRPSRNASVIITTTDPTTGAQRTLDPWRRGGIRAAALQTLVDDAGGSLLDALTDAMGSGQAGSTDLDALDNDGAGVTSVTVSYQ